MTKWVVASIMDSGLNYLKTNGAKLVVVSNDPSDFSDVTTGTLAEIAVSASDFTVAASGTGRKVTVGAQTSMSVVSSILSSSTFTAHACVVSGAALLLKTSCTSRAVKTGDKLNTSEFVLKITQPV